MFGKKKKEEGEEEPNQEENSEESNQESAPEAAAPSGDLSVGQVAAEVEKLKAQFSSFYEMQKAANERFSRINEQIGELRAMLIDRDRASQHLEAKATQAVDMVESIQPDKLMIEVRKSDAKVEGLRATIEGNEAILSNSINELKELRTKLNQFKGMDEILKLSGEVKQELSQMKLIESTIQRHADKVDTIFGEMGKSFGEFTKFADNLKNLDATSKQLATDVDALKVQMKEAAQKKEQVEVKGRVDEFEKKVGNVMNLINKKFEDIEQKNEKRMNSTLEKADKLLKGFDTLAKKTPDLDKYFNLLDEEAKKAAQAEADKKEGDVEKIKEPGQEENVVEKADEEAKKDKEEKSIKGKIGKLNPLKKAEGGEKK